MKMKLAAVVLAATVAAPTLAQVQTDADRRPLSPREEEFERLRRERQQQEEQQQRIEDALAPTRYEGTAQISSQRPGKCPPRGFVRAEAVGNRFTATIVFPIDRQVVRGHISGSRVSAQGEFGYSLEGSISRDAVLATATRKAQTRPADPRPLTQGVPLFFGSQNTPSGQRLPPVEDCTYSVSLARVS